MPKSEILTLDQVDSHQMNPLIRKRIEEMLHTTDNDKKAFRILDYGSGRGATVACLRKLGYEAYGAEIDPVPFNNGKDYFRQIGLDHDQLFQLLNEKCETSFPENYFDFVFSEQVFEHVQDLDLVMKELDRVTKPGAVHFHVFPAKYHFIEQHLDMPIIHWLPKNTIRYYWALLCVYLGAEPQWKQLKGKKPKEKAKLYSDYSIEKTFYRSIGELRKTCLRHGFTLKYQFAYQYSAGLVLKVINKTFPSMLRISLTKKR